MFEGSVRYVNIIIVGVPKKSKERLGVLVVRRHLVHNNHGPKQFEIRSHSLKNVVLFLGIPKNRKHQSLNRAPY